MEGDFVQYSPEGAQTQPLSYDQTGQLAAQITSAIKCNDPPAIVAWNYSTWISTTQRDSYFNGINTNVAKLGTSYEMVFTSGKGNTTSAGTGTTWDQLYTALATNRLCRMKASACRWRGTLGQIRRQRPSTRASPSTSRALTSRRPQYPRTYRPT